LLSFSFLHFFKDIANKNHSFLEKYLFGYIFLGNTIFDELDQFSQRCVICECLEGNTKHKHNGVRWVFYCQRNIFYLRGSNFFFPCENPKENLFNLSNKIISLAVKDHCNGEWYNPCKAAEINKTTL